MNPKYLLFTWSSLSFASLHALVHCCESMHPWLMSMTFICVMNGMFYFCSLVKNIALATHLLARCEGLGAHIPIVSKFQTVLQHIKSARDKCSMGYMHYKFFLIVQTFSSWTCVSKKNSLCRSYEIVILHIFVSIRWRSFPRHIVSKKERQMKYNSIVAHGIDYDVIFWIFFWGGLNLFVIPQ